MCDSRHPLNGADSSDPITPSKQCMACSDPAVPGDIYCAGHDRLLEYVRTTPDSWAANE